MAHPQSPGEGAKRRDRLGSDGRLGLELDLGLAGLVPARPQLAEGREPRPGDALVGRAPAMLLGDLERPPLLGDPLAVRGRLAGRRHELGPTQLELVQQVVDLRLAPRALEQLVELPAELPADLARRAPGPDDTGAEDVLPDALLGERGERLQLTEAEGEDGAEETGVGVPEKAREHVFSDLVTPRTDEPGRLVVLVAPELVVLPAIAQRDPAAVTPPADGIVLGQRGGALGEPEEDVAEEGEVRALARLVGAEQHGEPRGETADLEIAEGAEAVDPPAVETDDARGRGRGEDRAGAVAPGPGVAAAGPRPAAGPGVVAGHRHACSCSSRSRARASARPSTSSSASGPSSWVTQRAARPR